MQSFSEGIFSLVVFVRTFSQVLGLLPAPCEEPLFYTLGTIDSRFDISEDEVRAALRQAEALWEKDTGRNLFEYHETDGIPIQFLYDERQEKTEAQKGLEKRLDTLNLKESTEDAKVQIARYENMKARYEQEKSAYEQNVKQYNARVSSINKKGGATADEQEALAEEQKNLKEEFQALENLRSQVNALAGEANQQIAANQVLVETYNQEIATFQERYGGEGEVFDQGMYTGRDISIYQYDDTPRLVMVLAHELGHALGIEHVEDPGALMYYLMRDQDVTMPKLPEADRAALEHVCQPPKFPWQN